MRPVLAAIVALSLAALAFAAAPATVRLKQEGVTLDLFLEGGGRLSLTTKPTTLKAGNYNVKALRLVKKDDKGAAWELRSDGDLGKCSLNNVAVDEGQEKVVEDVLPVIFKAAIWQRPTEAGKPRTVLIRFGLYGRYSEPYYPGAYLKGEKPPMPEWRIVDEQGKVLGGGRMPDGPGPEHYVNWTVPEGFLGKVRLELAPVMGPFEWKLLGAESVVTKEGHP